MYKLACSRFGKLAKHQNFTVVSTPRSDNSDQGHYHLPRTLKKDVENSRHMKKLRYCQRRSWPTQAGDADRKFPNWIIKYPNHITQFRHFMHVSIN